MRTDGLLRILKRYWLLSLLLLVILFGAMYVLGRGRLSVSVSPVVAGGSITITNQQSHKSTTVKLGSGAYTKLLPKGNYEVSVTNKNQSAFNIVRVNGFFKRTIVSDTLTSEKSREFVGNNPRSCMYYIHATLYSYYCNDTYRNVAMHVPATATQPNYITTNKNGNIDAAVEANATTKQGDLVLLRAVATEDTSKPLHTVYVSGNQFELKNPVPLPDLNNQKSYLMQPYEDGFIAYDTKYQDVFYYPSTTSKPQRFVIPTASDASLKRTIFGASNDTAIVARSDKSDFQNHDNTNIKIGNVKTQLTIFHGGDTKNIMFTQKLDNYFVSITPCGTDKACLVSNQVLYVYDISGNKAKLLFTLNDAKSVSDVNSQLIVVQALGVLNLDVDKQSGYYEYTFGKYEYCGLQSTSTGYLLCVRDPKTTVTYALNITQSKDDLSDGIDKKFLELLDVAEIKSASMYKNFVFISPELGELVYNKSLRSFGYDPVVRKNANQKIDEELTKLGFNKSTYTITNTANY